MISDLWRTHNLKPHRVKSFKLSNTCKFNRAQCIVMSPCPARVILLGGDCLPTLGRALLPRQKGALPRFLPRSEEEAAVMMEAGDGRVTRASVLASHLPQAEDSDTGSGLPEVRHAFFGSADHHGIYREPTFQSILLRLLLRPSRPRLVEIREGRTA